jgi:hypothetical protein
VPTYLILLSLFSPPALAQLKDDLVVTATVGWNGVIPGDRWAPITVFITAGEKPIEGMITADFAQDPTQSAHITVPFAATPQRTTPVTLVAAIPNHCDRLTLTLLTRDRRIPLEFTSSVSNDTLPLPPVLESSTAVVLAVGRGTLPEAVRDWEPLAGMKARKLADDPTILEPVWGQIVAARAEPESLPNVWAAYQGLSAMVVPGDAARSMDRSALAAIHDWVQSGGRLLIIADGPGEQWRDWLPENARTLIQAESPGTHPLPKAVAESIETLKSDLASPKSAWKRIEGARKNRPQNPYYNPGYGAAEEPAPSKVVLPGPAAQVPSRVFRLTDEAKRNGWRLAWTTETDETAGMLAEGPVGFGHVTILGLEPSHATQILSTRASGSVWREALKPALADFLSTAPWQDTQGAWNYYTTDPAQNAVNATLESMAKIPSVGGWVVAAFAAGLILLVLLVGPVDYFTLKRLRAGQHWWLTAIGWTSVACVIAWAAPALVRTSPTQLARTSVVDCILSKGDGSPDSSLTAWETGLTAIYAGESGVLRPTVDPASWWRGTAAVFYWFRADTAGRGIAPTLQQAAGGAAGSVRGNPIQPFAMPLWTFRSFLDDSRATVGLGAKVRTNTDEGVCHAMVTGLPEGVHIERALVRIGDTSFGRAWINHGAAGNATGGGWSADLRPNREETEMWASQPAIIATYPRSTAVNVVKSAFLPATALSLNGPAQRTAAAARLTSTSRWAMLLLQVNNWPAAPAIDRPAKSEHTRILRLLVPLSDSQ